MQHEGARLTRLVGELMELSRVQGVDPMPNALVVTAMLLFPGQDKIVGEQIRKTLKDPKSVGTYDPSAARPNRG